MIEQTIIPNITWFKVRNFWFQCIKRSSSLRPEIISALSFTGFYG